jgi:hypothetical protein
MKKMSFKSVNFPEMDPFLYIMEKAINNLLGDKKYNGFCVAYYDSAKETIVAEKIGKMNSKKTLKCFYLSAKKVVETMIFGAKRSKDFEDKKIERFSGAVCLYENCAGVTGQDSMLNEAIAVSWLIAKDYLVNCQMVRPVKSEIFWRELSETAKYVEKHTTPDNGWVSAFADLLYRQFLAERI